ncbi:DUF1566 domain-containing protein [Vibrio sp. 10N.261.52.A1]|uniref:DUF1566 domain-containing protein n=1 Tax=Vibrio TaxID=662 RepID=UPI000C817973|nr:DUF1566 domain-containing protein [Vibrio sp. 10N.261.52.A1]PML15939.1 hypothetical protein BCT81_04520 [Vibrio sp. 10N.261.52.A1]
MKNKAIYSNKLTDENEISIMKLIGSILTLGLSLSQISYAQQCVIDNITEEDITKTELDDNYIGYEGDVDKIPLEKNVSNDFLHTEIQADGLSEYGKIADTGFGDGTSIPYALPEAVDAEKDVSLVVSEVTSAGETVLGGVMAGVAVFSDISSAFSNDHAALSYHIWAAENAVLDGCSAIPGLQEICGPLALISHIAESIKKGKDWDVKVSKMIKKVASQSFEKSLNSADKQALAKLDKLDNDSLKSFTALVKKTEREIENNIKQFVMASYVHGSKYSELYASKLDTSFHSINNVQNQIAANYVQKALINYPNSREGFERVVSAIGAYVPLELTTKIQHNDFITLVQSSVEANETKKQLATTAKKELGAFSSRFDEKIRKNITVVANYLINGYNTNLFERAEERAFERVKRWYAEKNGDKNGQLRKCDYDDAGELVCVTDTSFKVTTKDFDRLPQLKTIFGKYNGKRDFSDLINDQLILVKKSELDTFKAYQPWLYRPSKSEIIRLASSGRMYEEDDLVFSLVIEPLPDKYQYIASEEYNKWVSYSYIHDSIHMKLYNVRSKTSYKHGAEFLYRFLTKLEYGFKVREILKSKKVQQSNSDNFFSYRGTYNSFDIVTGNNISTFDQAKSYCQNLNNSVFQFLGTGWRMPTLKEMKHLSTKQPYPMFIDTVDSPFKDDSFFISDRFTWKGSDFYRSFNPKTGVYGGHYLNTLNHYPICIRGNNKLVKIKNITKVPKEKKWEKVKLLGSHSVVLKNNGKEHVFDFRKFFERATLSTLGNSFYAELSAEDDIYRGIYRDLSFPKCSTSNYVNRKETHYWGDVVYKSNSERSLLVLVPCGDLSKAVNYHGRSLTQGDLSVLAADRLSINSWQRYAWFNNKSNLSDELFFKLNTSASGREVSGGVRNTLGKLNPIKGTYVPLDIQDTYYIDFNVYDGDSGVCLQRFKSIMNSFGGTRIPFNCDGSIDASRISPVDFLPWSSSSIKAMPSEPVSLQNKQQLKVNELADILTSNLSLFYRSTGLADGLNKFKIEIGQENGEIFLFKSNSTLKGLIKTPKGKGLVEGTVNNGFMELSWFDLPVALSKTCNSSRHVGNADYSVLTNKWGKAKVYFDDNLVGGVGTINACGLQTAHKGDTNFVNFLIFQDRDNLLKNKQTLAAELVKKMYVSHLNLDGISTYTLEPTAKSTGTIQSKRLSLVRQNNLIMGFHDGAKVLDGRVTAKGQFEAYVTATLFDHANQCKQYQQAIHSNSWAKIHGFFDDNILLLDYALCDVGMPSHEFVMVKEGSDHLVAGYDYRYLLQNLRHHQIGRDSAARWVIKNDRGMGLEWEVHPSHENCNRIDDEEDCAVPENSKNAKFDPDSFDLMRIVKASDLKRTDIYYNSLVEADTPYRGYSGWNIKQNVTDKLFIFSDTGSCELMRAPLNRNFSYGTFPGNFAADSIGLDAREANLFFACGGQGFNRRPLFIKRNTPSPFGGKELNGTGSVTSSSRDLTDNFEAIAAPIVIDKEGVDHYRIKVTYNKNAYGMEWSNKEINSEERQAKTDTGEGDLFKIERHDLSSVITSFK